MAPTPEDRADGGIAEKLEFEPVERRKSSRKWGRLVAFLILVGLTSGGVWILWGKEFVANQQSGDVPIVHADLTPIKVKPADPGGMDVPNRDKLVYNRINGEGAGSKVEHLLPPPEEPLPLPGDQNNSATVSEPTQTATSSGQVAAQSSAQKTEQGEPMALEPVNGDQGTNQGSSQIAPPPPDATGVNTQTAVSEATKAPPPPPEPASAVQTQTQAQAATKSEPTIQKATKTNAQTQQTDQQVSLASRLPTSNTYRIQLAALRSQDRAEAEWKRLRAAHTDLLGRLGLSIVRVDLGKDKGIFYRLRAGPLPDAATAKALCAKLSSRNVGCLVVRPSS